MICDDKSYIYIETSNYFFSHFCVPPNKNVKISCLEELDVLSGALAVIRHPSTTENKYIS